MTQCPVPVAVFCLFFTSQEINTKRSPNATKLHGEVLWTRRHPMGQGSAWGVLKGSTTHQGAPGGPDAPWWAMPTSGAPRTASLLYKYPNIPKTLGESTKFYSRRRKFQNHGIQYRALFRHSIGGNTMGFIILIGASPMMRG